jgi:hypothetical protein
MSRPLPIGEIPLYTIDYVIWTKQSQIKSLDGCAGVLAETCGVLMNLSCGVETSASLSDIINM